MLAATAGECARAYHQYGAALFAKAQEDADVFGSSVHQQASTPQKTNVTEGAHATDCGAGGSCYDVVIIK